MAEDNLSLVLHGIGDMRLVSMFIKHVFPSQVKL